MPDRRKGQPEGLREHLRDRLIRRESDRSRAKLRRQAVELAEHSQWTEAVALALEAGEAVLATNLAAKAARLVVKQGQLQTILHWLPQLPQLELERHPELLWAAARAFTYTHQLERAEHCLQRLSVLVGDQAEWQDDMLALEGLIATVAEDLTRIDAVVNANLPRTHSAYGRGILLNLQGGAALARARFDEALAYFDLADTRNAEAGNWLGMSATLALRAMALATQGQLTRALACYFGEFAADHPSQGLAPYQQVAAGIHAELLYEIGDLDALRHLLRCYPPTEDGYLAISMMVGGHLAAARLCWLEEGLQPALAQLDHAVHRAVQRRFDRLTAACRWEQVRLATLSGNLRGAERLADRAPALAAAASVYYTTDLEAVDVAELRLCVRAGSLKPDDSRLLCLIADARESGRRWRELKLELVRIQAALRVADLTVAEQALADLMRWALPAGFRRSIVDEGDVILQILRRWRDDGSLPPAVSGEHVDALLHMANGLPVRVSSDGRYALGGGEALSGRELALLRAVAAGDRNRELAERFGLSENTVKWYLKGLYGKLAARNRAEAIAHARKLDLLD